MITQKDSTKQFNVVDHLGSVRETFVVKGAAQSWKGYDYKPFGDTLLSDRQNRIGYGSEERDEESRYFNFGFRQYDPLTGRFLSPDPLFEKFTFYSPYQYAYNNPVSFKDPTGLAPESEKKKSNKMLRTEIEDIMADLYYVSDKMDAEMRWSWNNYLTSLGYRYIERTNSWFKNENDNFLSNAGARLGNGSSGGNGINSTTSYYINYYQEDNSYIFSLLATNIYGYYYYNSTGVKDESGNWNITSNEVLNTNNVTSFWEDAYSSLYYGLPLWGDCARASDCIMRGDYIEAAINYSMGLMNMFGIGKMMTIAMNNVTNNIKFSIIGNIREPSNLIEHFTMQEIKSNPKLGIEIMKNLDDPNWQGWSKWQYFRDDFFRNYKVNIHYNVKTINGKIIDATDFKIIRR